MPIWLTPFAYICTRDATQNIGDRGVAFLYYRTIWHKKQEIDL